MKWALAPMFAGAIVDLSDLRKVSHPSRPESVRSNIYFIPSASEGDGETNGVAEEKPRRKSILMRFWSLIKAYIIEPLSTARRFIHLALIFLPVIITAPILLLEYMDIGRDKAARRRGRNKPKDSEERSTTTWWYGLLVSQMERAGPTFIKVSRRHPSNLSFCDVVVETYLNTFRDIHSSLNGPARGGISSQPACAKNSVDSIPMGNHILCDTPRKYWKRRSTNPLIRYSRSLGRSPWVSVQSLR